MINLRINRVRRAFEQYNMVAQQPIFQGVLERLTQGTLWQNHFEDASKYLTTRLNILPECVCSELVDTGKAPSPAPLHKRLIDYSAVYCLPYDGDEAAVVQLASDRVIIKHDAILFFQHQLPIAIDVGTLDREWLRLKGRTPDLKTGRLYRLAALALAIGEIYETEPQFIGDDFRIGLPFFNGLLFFNTVPVPNSFQAAGQMVCHETRRAESPKPSVTLSAPSALDLLLSGDASRIANDPNILKTVLPNEGLSALKSQKGRFPGEKNRQILGKNNNKLTAQYTVEDLASGGINVRLNLVSGHFKERGSFDKAELDLYDELTTFLADPGVQKALRTRLDLYGIGKLAETMPEYVSSDWKDVKEELSIIIAAHNRPYNRLVRRPARKKNPRYQNATLKAGS